MKTKKAASRKSKPSCDVSTELSKILVASRKPMTLAQIQEKAVSLGIEPQQMNKTQLIHAIQNAEGNQPCFGTSDGWCPYTDCCFMPNCLQGQ
jgi:hypothetical protein